MITATIKQYFNLALVMEERGELLYGMLAKLYEDNEEVSEILNKLLADEVHHAKQFKYLLETFDDTPIELEAETERKYFEKLLTIDIFDLKKGPLSTFEKLTDKEDVLKLAYNFEKYVLDLYLGIREIIGENEVLNAIVETEKEHVRQVKRYLLTNSKFRGLGEKAIEYAV